jgi:hypothetical protein
MIVAESTGILDEKNARVLLILEERHGRGDRVDREKFDLARRMLIVLSVALIVLLLLEQLWLLIDGCGTNSRV